MTMWLREKFSNFVVVENNNMPFGILLDYLNT